MIEYCKYHVEAGPQEGSEKPGKSEEEVKTWDNEFVKVDQGTLFELILVRSLCSPLRRGMKLACRDSTLVCTVDLSTGLCISARAVRCTAHCLRWC